MKFRDRLYVFMLGAAIVVLAWIWRFESVPPDLMDALAAAAGLRPPAEPLSLLWCQIARPVCQNFGLNVAELVLRTTGHVTLGILAVMATSLFEMVLPATLKRGEHIARWWRVTRRVVLFQGTILFCLSDPVWNAFRWFSPLSLHVLMAVAAAICYLKYLWTNRRFPLFVSFALIGLLSVDTPSGVIVLLAAIIGLYVRNRLRAAGVIDSPVLENPLANAFMAWRITLAYLIGAGLALVLSAHTFKSLGGLDAFDWTWSDYAVKVPFAYLKAFLATCTPVGAVFIVLLVILPVVAGCKMIRRATDEEKPLAYIYGVMFLISGLVALSQLSGAKPLWFWTWIGDAGCVRDGILKCIAMCLCAISAIWALAVFTIELYLRNFRRVESLRMQDEAEENGAAEAFSMVKRMQRVVRAFLLVEPIVVLACVVPFRAQRLERAMLDVVADAAKETVEECKGAQCLFTDGGLDAAVELAAAREVGRVSSRAAAPLLTYSMMGGADDPREKFLRTRAVTNAEDKAVLESGAADALRTWVRTRPEKASSYAVQIGFELWRRDGRSMPECSGLVARPAGFAPGAAERGATVGRALAKRMLALYDAGSPDKILDRSLRDAFLFVQWRLAVLARHRANAYDERGKTALAMEETRIADALDKKNGALARIRATMAWASKKKLERMTPQEGLRFGLAKADFALARVFALKVLEVSPDDPAANFALGMDFFVQKQYARAQAYLKQCLVRRPNDPAVLNNLAQCRLRQGDPVGALPYAKRAQEILPESPEIKRTIERINAAIEKKQGEHSSPYKSHAETQRAQREQEEN